MFQKSKKNMLFSIEKFNFFNFLMFENFLAWPNVLSYKFVENAKECP